MRGIKGEDMDRISCEVAIGGIRKTKGIIVYEDNTIGHFFCVEASGKYGDNHIPLSVSFSIDPQDVEDFPIGKTIYVSVGDPMPSLEDFNVFEKKA